MIDPMFKRLAGCAVVAAMLTGALGALAADKSQAKADAEITAKMQSRMQFASYTRQ